MIPHPHQVGDDLFSLGTAALADHLKMPFGLVQEPPERASPLGA